MSTSRHRDYLESLGLDVIKQKSVDELWEMTTSLGGFSVSRDAVRNATKRILALADIISTERSLKGQDMREPTKDDISRLRAICEERGLPPY